MREEYKMTELGEIPVEWEIKQFSDISKINQGLQIAIEDRFKEMSINRLPYITIQYINDRNNVDNQFYIENANRSVICHKDDILMTRTGNTGVVVTNEHGVFHNNFFKVEYDRNTLVKDFIVYYLNLHKIQALILNYAGTTTIPDLKHKDFYRLPIVIPTLKEQQKIADILSTVDEQIENIESLIEKTKELKKGLMQKLLTKGIGNSEFKETEVGVIPKGWKVKSFIEISQGKGEYGIGAIATEYVEGSPRYLRITDIGDESDLLFNDIKGLDDEDYEKYILKHNDIVFARTGNTTGKSYAYNIKDGELVYAGFLIKFSINPKFANVNFIKYIVQTKRYWDWVSVMSTRSGQPGINSSEYAKLLIQVPSVEEQNQIASILSSVDEKIEQYEVKKEKLQQLKQGLMQKLLTGKIRVV